MKSVTLQSLAEILSAKVQGDASVEIYGVATLDSANSGQITFLSNSKYRNQLAQTNASAVLLTEQDAASYDGNALILADPYVAFAKIAQLLDTTPASAQGIHPSAQIDASVKLGEEVSIGANAVIGANVILGDKVQIGAGTVIGQDSIIGSNTKLWANVTIYHDVQIGMNCIIHSAAVIGSDGFGYANEAGKWVKIPQVGGVRIGDGVEIGAGSTIDRGALDNTEIHDGVIIDNQVQIAHNDVIGAHSAIAGCTVIAGSVTLGKHCIVGGNSAIAGHLTICDGVHISGGTNITHSVSSPGLFSSATVAMDNKLWRRNTVRFRQLDDLFQRVKIIEKAIKS